MSNQAAAEVFGICGGVLVCVVQLPQVIKTVRSCNVQGLSLTSYILSLFAAMCWVVYGALLPSAIVVVSNVVSACCTCFIIGVMAYVWRKERMHRQNIASIRV